MKQEFSKVRSLVFEPYTLFRVRPMAGRAVNVSNVGYRSTGTPQDWPLDRGALNIFVFGGSTAFGYGVMDAETIPAQLNEHLAALLPERRTSVYNFATPNFACVQERIRLEQLMVDGHVPSVAIFIDGFAEFIAPYYAPQMFQRFVDATDSAESLRDRFWRSARKLRSPLICRVSKIGASRPAVPDPGQVLEHYFRNMRLVASACGAFAVKPLFVWQPVPCYHYDGEALHGQGHGSSERLIDCVRAGYEMMNARRDKDFSGERNLWLGDIQIGRKDQLYVDPDHYNPAFSREIAATIARHLLDHGFIK
jgi:hypothetical protein